MIKIIHNIDTNEVTEEALTQDEINEFLANRAEQEQINFQIEENIETKRLAKAALLERLGITEEEARLLLS